MHFGSPRLRIEYNVKQNHYVQYSLLEKTDSSDVLNGKAYSEYVTILYLLDGIYNLLERRQISLQVLVNSKIGER